MWRGSHPTTTSKPPDVRASRILAKPSRSITEPPSSCAVRVGLGYPKCLRNFDANSPQGRDGPAIPISRTWTLRLRPYGLLPKSGSSIRTVTSKPRLTSSLERSATALCSPPRVSKDKQTKQTFIRQPPCRKPLTKRNNNNPSDASFYSKRRVRGSYKITKCSKLINRINPSPS